MWYSQTRCNAIAHSTYRCTKRNITKKKWLLNKMYVDILHLFPWRPYSGICPTGMYTVLRYLQRFPFQFNNFSIAKKNVPNRDSPQTRILLCIISVLHNMFITRKYCQSSLSPSLSTYDNSYFFIIRFIYKRIQIEINKN